jgi:hypothetical protein
LAERSWAWREVGQMKVESVMTSETKRTVWRTTGRLMKQCALVKLFLNCAMMKGMTNPLPSSLLNPITKRSEGSNLPSLRRVCGCSEKKTPSKTGAHGSAICHGSEASESDTGAALA